jgi:cell division transport system permease protein
MGRLLYFVREALRGFYQAKLVTAISVVTIGVSLFVMGVVGIVLANAQRWLTSVSQRADIVVYVDEALGRDTTALQTLAAQVAEFPQVAGVEVIDKGEAWTRFQSMYGSAMLDMVDDNPLPASLELALARGYQDERSAEALTRELGALAGVESVDYSAAQLASLRRLWWYLAVGAGLLGALCLLVLHFVVANTVKLTIYARKELVINMRFLGATDTFIETPFILEGMLQGFLGGCIALAGIELIRFFAADLHLSWGPPYLRGLLVGLGVLFAWWGSQSAVRRFLA